MIEHVRPETTEDLCCFLKECSASGQSVVPFSPGELPQDSALAVKYFLTPDRLRETTEHSLPDQVISVQTGLPVRELNSYLRDSNQWFPVNAPGDGWTLCDLISTGRAGCLEHRFGGPRDLALGLHVALPSGVSIKCGGKVVKNVTGYDLTKLFTGSWASLAVPHLAHLRLYALPESGTTMLIQSDSAATIMDSAQRVRRSGLPVDCLEIVSPALARDLAAAGLFDGFDPAPEPGRTVLLVRVTGGSALVKEVADETVRIAGIDTPPCFLDFKSDDELWSAVSFPERIAGRIRVEVVAQGRQLRRLIGEAGVPPRWTMRPGRTKLMLFADDAAMLDDIAGSLAAWARQESAPVVWAGRDRRFLHHVRYHPDDPAKAELKRRIKNEFDPSGILNPLVSL